MRREYSNRFWKKVKKKLNNLLKKWENGEIHPYDIEDEIDYIEYKKITDYPEFERGDPRSIIVEVLSNLGAILAFRILKSDIPVIMEFLNTKEGNELIAWEKWDRYWDEVNLEDEKRKMEIEKIIREYFEEDKENRNYTIKK